MGVGDRPKPWPNSDKTSTEETKEQSNQVAVPLQGGIITHASPGTPATRAVRPQGVTPYLPYKALTYGDLKEYHLERIRIDAIGRERSPAVLKNHRCIINSWTGFLLDKTKQAYTEGAGDTLPLGEEIGANFPVELAAYITLMGGRGKRKATLLNNKSIMWAVHESAVELIKTRGLPEGFSEALDHLISEAGLSSYQISHMLGLDEKLVSFWRQGRSIPALKSLPTIERLEDLFALQRGTLSSRLPHFGAVCVVGRPEAGTTPWRKHLSELHKYNYGLKGLPPQVQAEFDDLVRFYTDDIWVEERGFKRNSEWRIRRNRGESPTAEIYRKRVDYFLGYLRQPTDGHPWLRGKGLPVESHSLALLTNADLVISYVEFLRERTQAKAYNNGTITFVILGAMLMRKETGFLRQQPAYGLRLPEPVPADRWDEWCDTNRKRLTDFLKKISKSKNKPFHKTRDPFAPVRNIIEERQHPIGALMEMIAHMKRLIPLRTQNGPEFLAVHMRNLAFAEFITSYPLRVENFSLMKWIPSSAADILAYDKPFIETDEESNLYQKPDGSWWIRFDHMYVKNAKALDVPVAKSVVPSLKEYLFKHRPVLNRSIRRSLGWVREHSNLPPLTRAEERAVDLCSFVFRPCPMHIRKKSVANLGGYKGVDQIMTANLSQAMFVLTQKLIPNCKGFRPHAVRHIVASEYIKNYPNGYAVAAAALNITEKVVREHYAWVRPCDQIKPWQDYHENLRERFESGAYLG